MKPPRLVEGQYLILERLGKDEVGAAFLVEDQESGARVVLRSLRPSIVSDPDLSQKLEREVKLAQSLRHAHIRALYEFCWTKDKSEAFIVMEYIQGETLRDYLFKQRGYRCDKAAFYTLANQILSAIDYAHQAGVTHRDLTPDNIMITSEGSIKVSDFGIDATIKEALFKNTLFCQPTMYPPNRSRDTSQCLQWTSTLLGAFSMKCWQENCPSKNGMLSIGDQKSRLSLLMEFQ